MIEEKIDDFMKHFTADATYAFFGLSRELIYFLDLLKRNGIAVKPACFSDPEIKQPARGALGDRFRNITDPVAQRVLQQHLDVSFVPPEQLDSSCKIVVTTDMYRNEIFKSLVAKGLKRDVDFCLYKDALSYWSYGLHKKAYVQRIDQFVTSRCTLNCTHCNMYIPYFDNPKDRTLDQLKSEADNFFTKIDSLGIFHLVGGEPLLNKNLEEYVEYLGSRYYGSKFHHFWITSNGTVAPSPALSELFKRYNIFVSVTDYSSVLPHIANKTKRTLAIYKDNSIPHLHNVEKNWIDFGDPRKVYETSEKKLKNHFQRCTVPYRGLAQDRFYYCNLSVGADESGAKPAKEGDFVIINADLKPLELVWYDLGNVPKGFVTLCESCSGCNTGVGEEVQAGASQGLRVLE